MDLGAYANIEYLDAIARKNGIEVPRLRGYRLMAIEKPLSYPDMLSIEMNEFSDFCCSRLGTEIGWEFSQKTDSIKKRYGILVNIDDWDDYRPDWSKIHGKHRAKLKFWIKKRFRRYKKQTDTFNKYVGRKDVLYIHARIGGDNWECCNGDELVASQPWFLDRCDDAFDSTYCDIYAKIEEV